jgi:hypothetical protein
MVAESNSSVEDVRVALGLESERRCQQLTVASTEAVTTRLLGRHRPREFADGVDAADRGLGVARAP